MRLGADVEQLDRLAVLLERSAGELRALRADLTGAVAVLSWQGPDARQFTEIWRHRHDRQIEIVAAGFAQAASTAWRNTSEQRSVSTDNSGSSTGILGGPGVLGALGGPNISPAPTRIQIVHVDLGGGDAVRGDLGMTVRVEDIGGGQIRVTEVSEASGGPSGGSGATADFSWGDARFGGGADISMTGALGLSGTHVWVIGEEELRPLLVARSRDLLMGPTGPLGASGTTLMGVVKHIPGAGSVAAATGLADEWNALSSETPRPVSVGMAVGVSAELAGNLGSAGASVASAISRLGFGFGANEQIGFEMDTASGAMAATFVMGGSASISGGVTGSGTGLAPATRSGEVRARVTFDPGGNPVRLDVVTQTDDANVLERQQVSVDLGHRDVQDAAGALKDALTGPGDLEAATRRVLVAGALHASEQVSRYELGESGRYGFDIGVANAEVTYQDFRYVS